MIIKCLKSLGYFVLCLVLFLALVLSICILGPAFFTKFGIVFVLSIVIVSIIFIYKNNEINNKLLFGLFISIGGFYSFIIRILLCDLFKYIKNLI